MRLTFSLLWFDDSESYFDSLDLDGLEGDISSWGFSPDIIKVTTPQEFKKYSPFESIDLIIVDYDLGDYEEGQEFIAELRENAIYTEVIFYTAAEASNLWKIIYEKQLEGVFVSNRNNIIPKISRVGRQSIRKVLDLENMRGIVMAEVGELDHLLDEIVEVGISGLKKEQQINIFNAFADDFSKQIEKSIEALNQFKEKPDIPSMISLSDSNKRWRNFNRLWKSHSKLKGRDKIGDYEVDVLIPRNALAHGIPEERDGYSIFHHKEKKFRVLLRLVGR